MSGEGQPQTAGRELRVNPGERASRSLSVAEGEGRAEGGLLRRAFHYRAAAWISTAGALRAKTTDSTFSSQPRLRPVMSSTRVA
jgi:hypothetical protein